MREIPADVAADLGSRIDEIHRINRLWHLMQEVAGPTSQRAIRLRTVKDALQLDLLEHFGEWVRLQRDEDFESDEEAAVLLRITAKTTSRFAHACHMPLSTLERRPQIRPASYPTESFDRE